MRHGDTAAGTNNDAAAVLNAKKKKKTYITPLVIVVSYKEYEKKKLAYRRRDVDVATSLEPSSKSSYSPGILVICQLAV